MKQQNNDEKMVKRDFWSKAKNIAYKFPMIEEAIAMYYFSCDKSIPYWQKGIVYGALAYLIIPFDAIPDMMGPIGYLDDAGVLTLAYQQVESSISNEHHKLAKAWLTN